MLFCTFLLSRRETSDSSLREDEKEWLYVVIKKSPLTSIHHDLGIYYLSQRVGNYAQNAIQNPSKTIFKELF